MDFLISIKIWQNEKEARNVDVILPPAEDISMLLAISTKSQPELSYASLPPLTTVGLRESSHKKYQLPLLIGETVAFLLSDDAKLADYQWIGIYDICKDVLFISINFPFQMLA